MDWDQKQKILREPMGVHWNCSKSAWIKILAIIFFERVLILFLYPLVGSYHAPTSGLYDNLGMVNVQFTLRMG